MTNKERIAELKANVKRIKALRKDDPLGSVLFEDVLKKTQALIEKLESEEK